MNDAKRVIANYVRWPDLGYCDAMMQTVLCTKRARLVSTTEYELATEGDDSIAMLYRIDQSMRKGDARVAYLNQRFTVEAPAATADFWCDASRAQASWKRELSNILGSSVRRQDLRYQTRILLTDPTAFDIAVDRWLVHLGVFVLNGDIRDPGESTLRRQLRKYRRYTPPQEQVRQRKENLRLRARLNGKSRSDRAKLLSAICDANGDLCALADRSDDDGILRMAWQNKHWSLSFYDEYLAGERPVHRLFMNTVRALRHLDRWFRKQGGVTPSDLRFNNLCCNVVGEHLDILWSTCEHINTAPRTLR